MNYWLMKSEPDTFSIDTLKEKKKSGWDGVRNYQARNFMRDEMKKGDLVQLKIYCEKAMEKMFSSHLDFLKQRTNSGKIIFIEDKYPPEAIVFTIKEKKIAIELCN